MIEKEVEALIKGEEFTGEFQGVSYEIEISWGEDWCVLVDLANFKPLSCSHTHFWLGKVQTQLSKTFFMMLFANSQK